MKLLLVAVIPLLVLLAGCAKPGEPADPTTTETESGQPTTAPTPGPENPPIVNTVGWPSAIQWTDCFGAGTIAYGPNVIFEAPVPEGWRFDWPINEIYTAPFECQRMAVGPYERGPVRLVIETYSAATQPESCLEGSFDRPDMMSNWWINDADIAAYLQSLGAPAHYAEIDFESQVAGDARVDTWTWRQEGSEDSWMTLEGHGVEPGSIPFVERVFWFNESLLGIMDLTEHGHYDFGAVPVGVMAPPSLYALNNQPTPYSGPSGGIYYDVELAASLQFFKDFECTVPA